MWYKLLRTTLSFGLHHYMVQCHIQMYFGTIWMVWSPKKVLVTLFPYIVHVKSKWNIVCEYLKSKIFLKDTNILPRMHWTSNIFRSSATTIGGFWVSLNYPILNFKKTVCPKNVWMRHWCLKSIFWSGYFLVFIYA